MANTQNVNAASGSLDRLVRHELKTWPEYFRKIKSGEKTFEIRKTDNRTFSVGDVLLLREFRACSRCNGSGRCNWDAWDRGPCHCKPPHGSYTGAKLEMRVRYITDFGQKEGQVVMAIVPNEPRSATASQQEE